MSVRIRVDADVCEGHGRCYSLAPEMFEPDEIGNAVVIGDGSFPESQRDQAELAAQNCPERAISVDGEIQ